MYTIEQLLNKQGLNLRTEIVSILDESKAEDIVTISLEGKSDIADYMVIASGTSSKHTSMVASNLLDKLKKTDPDITYSVEGMNEGEWVLLDTGDIIVHIFKPEIREIYQLEKMWLEYSPVLAEDF